MGKPAGAMTDEEMQAWEASQKPPGAMSDQEMQAFDNQRNNIKTYSAPQAFALHAANGLMGGTEPQMEGLIQSNPAGLDVAGDPGSASKFPLPGSSPVSDLLGAYRKARDNAYARQDESRAQHPLAAPLGDITGVVATGLVPGLGAVNAAGETSAGAKLASGVLGGAALGAGYSRADLTKGDVGQFAGDTLKGAAVGAVVPVLGAAAKGYSSQGAKTAEEARQIFDPFMKKAIPAEGAAASGGSGGFLDMLANAGEYAPMGFDKTIKGATKLIKGPIKSGADFLKDGATQAAAKLNDVFKTDPDQFKEAIGPILDLAKQGNSTAGVTLFLLNKVNPQAAQSINQGAGQ